MLRLITVQLFFVYFSPVFQSTGGFIGLLLRKLEIGSLQCPQLNQATLVDNWKCPRVEAIFIVFQVDLFETAIARKSRGTPAKYINLFIYVFYGLWNSTGYAASNDLMITE
jgi:hypothetical protein